ncbi:Uncharacterised protein [Mycobacteroides abscessus subsp. abscessus]|nr:Uncharacterised protein [Mycobacteroides abscessus subsp. abscessus]SIC78347.1 Uncharacterised protein [Mycobacteroides abscessus subsp. abscessus]SKP27269.1 Uncharacterised protein [Mycobacteroides abscessus subsp. abscessus]
MGFAAPSLPFSDFSPSLGEGVGDSFSSFPGAEFLGGAGSGVESEPLVPGPRLYFIMLAPPLLCVGA